MAAELDGKKVAILAAEMFEQVELIEPRDALEQSGAQVELVSLEEGEIRRASSTTTRPNAVRFVRDFFEQGKPIAAICHAPWTLVEAGVVRGRRLTSYPSLQTDIRNAGGEWVNEQVVVDGGIVTSRGPDDIPAFNAKMLEEFAEGKHAGRKVGSEAAAS